MHWRKGNSGARLYLFSPTLQGFYLLSLWERRLLCEGGDFCHSYAVHGQSIYGANLPNEKSAVKLSGGGILCVDIRDRYSLGSHFTIKLRDDPILDRFLVVFGKLDSRHEVLEKIVATADPYALIEVTNCSECNECQKDT
ncbi:peptidyl-prolyl cis-trans isomerase CYP95-like isoform X2 [Prosopis cineraria]|uniref:peptidyl-prolyl cis-trans isomerase CYP95-like isoform X2 n=1 Tax=Prosopis cineraria TaxID=364024 RepID=UPI00241041BC|nr:peptidyl-prolyl cis-trans isomerase CYP95-like isoform X2 [Prosopis cineraria]